MNNSEYLNEEKYQQAKKKITKISLIILIIGLALGAILIIIGVVKQKDAKKTNERLYNEAYALSEKKVAEANARLKEIATEKEKLNIEIKSKQYACDSLDMSSPSWFEDSTRCQSEVSSLHSKLGSLEMEEFKLENEDYTVYYNKIPNLSFLIFYYLGSSVIGTACLIAGIFYLIAKRREIRAFTIQQTMPVTQEVIGKMAPTIGNAGETIGKDIAKGITSGINEGKNG